jgi:hypothetical protein
MASRYIELAAEEILEFPAAIRTVHLALSALEVHIRTFGIPIAIRQTQLGGRRDTPCGHQSVDCVIWDTTGLLVEQNRVLVASS